LDRVSVLFSIVAEITRHSCICEVACLCFTCLQ